MKTFTEEEIDNEVWRIYEDNKIHVKYISDLGRTRLFNKKNGQWSDPKDTFGVSSGYEMVRQGKRMRQVHLIVAEAFLPNPNELPQVNHKNLIKTDNRLSNLEWVSRVENMLHCWNTRKFYPSVYQPYATHNGILYYNRRELAEAVGITTACLSYRKIAAIENSGYDKKYKIIFFYNRKPHETKPRE